MAKGKKIIAVKTYKDLNSDFKDQCVLPDVVGGIYGMIDNDTYFKDMGPIDVIEPSQDYYGRGLQFIGLGPYGDGDYWFGFNTLRNNGRIIVGKNKEDMVEIPTYAASHSWNSSGGNTTYSGSDNAFNSASADETIMQRLIDLGFSESDAAILAIGGSFIGHNGYKYIRFRDYIEEPFICDIKINNTPCEIYKYKFVGSGYVLPLDVIRTRYAQIQKIPPISLRIEKKTNQTNNLTLGEHVYVPAYVDDGTFDWEERQQMEDVENEMLALGLNVEYIKTFSRGVLIVAETKNGVLSIKATSCPQNVSGVAPITALKDGKTATYTVNGNQYIICMCIGDYNYLKELDKE